MNLRPIRRGVVALALALAPCAAFAQGMPTYQSGTVIPGHLLKSAGNGLQMDAGGTTGDANGKGVSPFSISDALGLGLCSNTAATSGQHYEFCLGHDASGNALLQATANGGATEKSVYLSKNGTLYEIPFVGAGGGNVVGPATTSVDHVATWNNSSGTLLKDVTALSLTGVVVQPSSSSLGQAVTTNQSVAGAVGADTFYNQVVISADNVVGPQHNLFGFGVYEICCLASAKGYHFSLAGRIDVNTPWDAADPEAVFVGVLGNARAAVNAPSVGAYLGGGNSNVQLTSGTGWNSVVGHEDDVGVFAAAAAPQVKVGHIIALNALDAHQGSGIDAGLQFTGTGTTPGWQNLILIDSGFGAQPIATTGTVLGMRNAATFQTGINFTNATITGGMLVGPNANFTVDGPTGAVFSNSTIWTGSNAPALYPASWGSGFAITGNFSNGGGEADLWALHEAGTGFRFYQKTGASTATQVMGVASDAPALTNTVLKIYVNNTTSGKVLADVTLGAADSGGAGFRALRVPN